MAAGSADPPPPERAQQERYGILELLRTRKDDGRSLILYSHDDDAEAGEASDRAPANDGEPA